MVGKSKYTIVINDIIKFLLKSVNHFEKKVWQITNIKAAPRNKTIGEIAHINILNIDIEGANTFNVAELANQSNDTADSDDVFTRDNGEYISVTILGKFILYAYHKVKNWIWLVKILSNTDLWLTPLFLILIVIRPHKNTIINKNNPTTFKPLRIGSGHFEHTNASTLS